MKVFLTGASGVLGSAVIPKLLREDIQVKSLVCSAQNLEKLRKFGVETAKGSLSDFPWLKEVVRDCDAILHLATKIPPSSQMKKSGAWDENDKIRTEGTKNVVEVALFSDVGTVIYPSVTLVYPDSRDKWIDAENAELNPARFLVSTLDAEKEVGRLTAAGRRGICLRMGSFYGAESSQSKEALGMARKGYAFLPGPESRFLSSIWIDDAAEAVLAALLRSPAGVYDVVDDNPLTKKETAKAIAHAVGRKKVKAIPDFIARFAAGKELLEAQSRSQRVSNKRFKELTGWSPKVKDVAEAWVKLSQLI